MPGKLLIEWLRIDSVGQFSRQRRYYIATWSISV